ncbi:hypothetical protein PENTCL1PPCAC_26315, partial [Pristionchus entomophagus]
LRDMVILSETPVDTPRTEKEKFLDHRSTPLLLHLISGRRHDGSPLSSYPSRETVNAFRRCLRILIED